MDIPSDNNAARSRAFVLRRRRKPVSCTPCRQRKLRCDQSLPACDSCVRRGDVMSCIYQYRGPGTHRLGPSSQINQKDVQSRIDRLEQLVLTVMGQKDSSATMNSTSDANSGEHFDALTSRYGNLVNQSLLQFRSSELLSNRMFQIDAHARSSRTDVEARWAILLNEIHEVQSYLQTQHKQYEAQSRKITQLLQRTPDDPGPTLLFGSSQLLSHGEILAHIPSKYTCDMFVDRYLSTMEPALHIIHPPTFRKQYEKHWEDPTRTSVVWIALLFAMMRVVTLSWERDGDEPLEYHGKARDLGRSYRTRVADCILLADYTKPHEFLIEALLFHLYGEYVSHRDADSSTWVLLGTIIRLAMRMGYHRDPARLPSLTPFQAEMRRRVWCYIREADIYFSFQHGFPSMVQIEVNESMMPRNIHDDSFGPECLELPIAVPESEATEISYLICKTRLAIGLARALTAINTEEGNPSSYGKILEIDCYLHDVYAKVPDHFRLLPMAEQQHDHPRLITARFCLANIYHKVRCVLHSPFLEAAWIDSRFTSSRRICLESAMALLKLQVIQHQGVGSRSLTRNMTSLVVHDYLLAVTVLCTELFRDCNGKRFQFVPASPSRQEMMDSLEQSVEIWDQLRDESLEAYKASDVLNMLLNKLRLRERPHTKSVLQPALPYTRGTTTSMAGMRTGLHSTQMHNELHTEINTMPPFVGSLVGSQLTYEQTEVESGVRSAPQAAHHASIMSSSIYSELEHSELRALDDQYSSIAWHPYAAPLDFSDPVSALWALDQS